MSDYPSHRPNVGVVLFHRDGRVWYGRRAGAARGAHRWQFPQGGVDEGEDFEAAALRELAEETGVTSVEVIGRTQGWITYDFPPEAQGSKIAKGWRGQKQVWFALRFTGKEREIRLDAHGEPEFDSWRWGRLDEAPDLVIPFKRGAYERVVEAFRHLAGKTMTGSILMIHGVGSTGEAFSRLAPAFREKGWRVEAPTLKPDLRNTANPPAALPKVRLKDYVDDMEAAARKLEAETGVAPVLMGHSMGGLIVQKLAERGVGRAAVLLTPASPADARSGSSLAQAFTFANILFTGAPETKSHRIWRSGFSWGVLNLVPKARHAAIFAQSVYDSGGVYADIAYPDKDPHGIATIDETRITIPVLTIGGARDRATPIADVRRVGAKYARVGGEYREYPDNAHWIVDEAGTDQVIADIAAWLESRGVTPSAAASGAKPGAKSQTSAGKAAPARKAASAKPATGSKAAAAKAAAPAASAAKPKADATPKTAPKAKAAPAAAGKTTKPAAKAPAKAKATTTAKSPAKAKAPAEPKAPAKAKAKTPARKPKAG